MPKTAKKPPAGYTYKYVWPDSDYVTHRRKVLVKKKKPVPARKKLSEPRYPMKKLRNR